MDPFERSNRRREAQRRLWAKRQRVGQLRGRVVAISLIAFALLWGAVFTQMATGNDPVLGAGAKSVARAGEGRGREREGRGAADPAADAASAANGSIETTDPEEVEAEPEYLEAEPEYVEPEPEPQAVEPEPEYFEPEPVETTQS